MESNFLYVPTDPERKFVENGSEIFINLRGNLVLGSAPYIS
jgi:hypothetical protein